MLTRKRQILFRKFNDKRARCSETRFDSIKRQLRTARRACRARGRSLYLPLFREQISIPQAEPFFGKKTFTRKNSDSERRHNSINKLRVADCRCSSAAYCSLKSH